MGIKALYQSICLRIYATGKLKYEDLLRKQNEQVAKFGKNTIFHDNCRIANLAAKPERVTFGENCHIYGDVVVYNYGGSVRFGDNCSLGEHSRIVSAKNIDIGNRVMIAHNVNIIDNNSHPKDANLRHEDFVNTYLSGMKEYDLGASEIKIEDDVWIGFNSIILKGVTIGRGAIIGAGSLVLKDVEPWTVNVGNPLRCIEKLQPINI